MVTLLRSDGQQTEEAPPIGPFKDAIENLCADYVVQHRVLPKYLYLNSTLWKDVQLGLLHTVEQYGLEVVTHSLIPYNRVSLHHEYQSGRDIGLWHRSFEDDGGLSSGRLAME